MKNARLTGVMSKLSFLPETTWTPKYFTELTQLTVSEPSSNNNECKVSKPNFKGLQFFHGFNFPFFY